MSKSTGVGRGAPGRLRSTRPRSKPCAICGQPMVAEFPSDLAKVRVHNRCKGLQATQRAAFTRIDLLEPRLEKLSVEARRAFLEGYRLGSQHTFKRYASRRRRQEAAA